MNVKQLKALIADLPDDLPVEVNVVSAGEYYDEEVSAFHLKKTDEFPAALVITVGDEE